MPDYLGLKVIIISNLCLAATILGSVNGGPQVFSPTLAQTVAETVREQVDLTSKLLREFEDFILKYGRSYASTAEKLMRFEIFKDNLKIIDELNVASDGTVEYGVNVFADLTFDEYIRRLNYKGGNRTRIEPETPRVRRSKKLTGYKPPSVGGGGGNNTEGGSSDGDGSGLLQAGKGKGKGGGGKPGAGIDLRTPPYPPVSDQGRYCGSCYAFSEAGAVAIELSKETKKIVDLSEQQIIDCSKSKDGSENDGCNGGLQEPTYRYIQQVGLTTDSAYPYKDKEGVCKKGLKIVAHIASYSKLPKAQIKAQLLAKKVFTTAMNAGTPEFKSYKRGILRPKKCDPFNLNHSVVIVGFQTVGNELIYIGRNSWAADWGENGHFLMSSTVCGIGDDSWKFTLKK